MRTHIIIMLLSLVGITVALSSCDCDKKDSCKKETCCPSVKPDSLGQLWNTAWNTKDLAALQNMIGEKAVVIEKEWFIEGRDSILAKWITINLPVVSNLTTEPMHAFNSCDCAGLTGYYTLDATTQEGVHQERGNFTFIWRMQPDKSWKLEVMHLTSL